VFLGLAQLWEIVLELIVSGIFLIVSRRFWLFALKYYTSASS
ncbi:MAG: ABC transporter permease, partial [Flavobacteriales bacterium]|nr:ABC transporter permease [Flavobacteriales bacterium]